MFDFDPIASDFDPRIFDVEDIHLGPDDFPEYDEYDRVQDGEFITHYTETDKFSDYEGAFDYE